jgi:hypothetical protein
MKAGRPASALTALSVRAEDEKPLLRRADLG